MLLCRSLLGVALATYFIIGNILRSDSDLTPRPAFEVWGVFHYYLGAKYFPELGFFNLYTCALEADKSRANAWQEITTVRDLHTYNVVARDLLPPCPLKRFSEERWRYFSDDIERFTKLASVHYWSKILTDKGFNATPFWVAIASPLANSFAIDLNWVDWIFVQLDVVAVLTAVAVIWWQAGRSAALLSLLGISFFFGNFERIGGNYLQYLWFPLLVASVALWRKARALSSGICMGIAIGLQVFPIAFAIAHLLTGLLHIVHHGRSHYKQWLRYSYGLSGAVCISLLLGATAGRGIEGWLEWEQKIEIHSSYLRGEIFNIGLANLVGTAGAGSNLKASNYTEDVQNTRIRLETIQHLRRFLISLQCILGLAVLIAMWRNHTNEGFALGLPITYIFLTLSPYYLLSIAITPYLFASYSPRIGKRALQAEIWLYLIHLPFLVFGYIFFSYALHLWSEAAIAIFIFYLLVIACRGEAKEGEGL